MALAPDSPVEKNLINHDEIKFFDVDISSSPAENTRENEEGPTAIINEEDSRSETVEPRISILQRREDARGQLAIVFTIATFVLFFAGFILTATTEGDKVENFKDIFLTISGVFSGLLGFVIGYYFRRGEEQNR